MSALSKLPKVKQLISSKKHDEALGLLLAAWRECRDASLADVIDRVSALIQRPELTGSAKKRHEEFLALAQPKKHDPADLGRMLAFLGEGQIAQFVAELDALEELPADPRFTPRALDLLQKPKATSSTSFTAWRRVFNALIRNEDLRAVKVLETLDFKMILGAGGDYSAAFFDERKVKTVAALKKVKPQTLGAADAALVKELLGSQQASTRDVSSLEAAVYAASDDLAPRSVLADALLEQNDPRGEFITLQLKGRLTGADRWREFDLLEEHRDAWLGPLTLTLNKWNEYVEFKNGFVDTIEVAADKPHAMKVLSEAPQFKTVRTVLLNLGDTDALPLELLRSAAFSKVTGLGWLRAAAFQQVLTASEPWSYEKLVCWEPDYDNISRDVSLLRNSKAIPRVKSLKLSGYSIKPAQLAALWSSALGKRLVEFGSTQGIYRVAEWVKEIEKHGLDARLEAFDLGFNFGGRDFAAVLRRGADGRLSDLEVCKRQPDHAYGTPKISRLAEELGKLPADRLTSFRYLGKLSKGDRKLLDAVLARQKSLTINDLR
ncbi:MAG: hypothetical protein QM817_32730 [Archangium sp.]